MKFLIALSSAALLVSGYPRLSRESYLTSEDVSFRGEYVQPSVDASANPNNDIPAVNYPAQPGWQPAQPGEARAPCPMLNTLANHNILPRSGRRITREILNDAISAYLKLDGSVANFLSSQALDGVGYDVDGVRYFDLDGLQR